MVVMEWDRRCTVWSWMLVILLMLCRSRALEHKLDHGNVFSVEFCAKRSFPLFSLCFSALRSTEQQQYSMTAAASAALCPFATHQSGITGVPVYTNNTTNENHLIYRSRSSQRSAFATHHVALAARSELDSILWPSSLDSAHSLCMHDACAFCLRLFLSLC